MNFTEKEYQDNIHYVKGIFTLGGLSECGKTTAGNRFKELGVRKSKIIHIEYEMMQDRGWDISNGVPSDYFKNLYANQPELVFKEFLFRLINKMKEENVQYASLESLYRAPLGAFIKKELGERAANIFIDTPLEVRALREMKKINDKAEIEGSKKVTLQEMIAKVSKKDEFKKEHHADDVKNIADYIVNNGAETALVDFINEIDRIAVSLGVEIPEACKGKIKVAKKERLSLEFNAINRARID